MAKYLTSFNTYSDYSGSSKNSPNVSLVKDTNTIYYNGEGHIVPINYEINYLTFVALEDGTFKFIGNSIDYSLDSGSTWTTLASDTNSPTVQSGHTIMWKGSGLSGRFSSTNRFNVQGNVMSLVYSDGFWGKDELNGTLANLFSGCTTLVSAEHLILPAKTIGYNGYSKMFYGCSSLTTAPQLPAKTVGWNGYANMFEGCSSLTTAPQLPATTLGTSSYQSMLRGCTSLTTAPELPATTLGSSCYEAMFYYCTNLVTAPTILPATTLVQKCYIEMFGRTKITTAPILPATTLVDSCYKYMFSRCSNLNAITCLATDISASNCVTEWLSNVASSGTFTKAASMANWPSGVSGIPTNWTVQDYQGN